MCFRRACILLHCHVLHFAASSDGSGQVAFLGSLHRLWDTGAFFYITDSVTFIIPGVSYYYKSFTVNLRLYAENPNTSFYDPTLS